MAINNNPQPVSVESAQQRMSQSRDALLGAVTEGSPSVAEIMDRTDESDDPETTPQAWNPGSSSVQEEAADTNSESAEKPETTAPSLKVASDEKEGSPDAKASGDTAKIWVTDSKGRREITVDYSDKEATNKAYQYAAGFRRMQTQRDEYKKNSESITAEYKSLKTDWDKLENAYKTGKVAGLVNLLEGRSDAYDSWLKTEVDRVTAYQEMSPSERAEFDRQEQVRKQSADTQKLKEEYEKKLQEITERQNATEEKALESKLHPSFDRYRFKGKLNDEVAETEFDEALWNRALSRLESVPEGTELTQALIDKTFRAVADSFKKHINSQVETKVKTVIDKKKESATKAVQAKASKGLKSATAEVEQFRKATQSGDVRGALSAWLNSGGRIFGK